MLGYAWGLVELTHAATGRRAFLSGFVLGLGVFPLQMGFLWTIFGIAAVPLWCVLAFWIGAFVWVGWLARKQFGGWARLLLPFLWIGLEYFRSELYFLRFTWLNMGYAFAEWPSVVNFWGSLRRWRSRHVACLLPLVLLARKDEAALALWVRLASGFMGGIRHPLRSLY